MVMGFATAASATTTISFDENGDAAVSDTAKDETASVSENSVDKTAKALETVMTVDPSKAYIALGRDLTQDQLATVLGLMGISAADLGNYNVVYITNSDEHSYLDKYVDPSIIGTKSLSSVLVQPKEDGHGVVVTTKNINYCTTNMYRNALITAGVENADIMVVAPTQISGTAALIGALKAYEKMAGENISDTTLDTALNELVATGAVSETVGDAEAEELISYIKAQIAANDLDTDEEIEAAVRKGVKDMNANLSEEEIQQIIDVMIKIKNMGIDFNVLAEQAEDIYAKYGDRIKAGTFNIDEVDWKDLGIGKIISNAVGNMVEKVGNTVKSFFKGLFSR